MDDPLSMRWVDIMLHYKTFPGIYHNILSWVDTQYVSVYTHIFTKITSFITLNYSIKMQFTKKMDVLIDEWN